VICDTLTGTIYQVAESRGFRSISVGQSKTMLTSLIDKWSDGLNRQFVMYCKVEIVAFVEEN